MTGGTQVVHSLLANGTQFLFGVPGRSYLALVDALRAAAGRVRFIACRHESGAALMAEAAGKLTGRAGACIVVRGPGAANAAVGVYTALRDSTPLIVLITQVERDRRHREALAEIDLQDFYRPLTKWVAEVSQPDRLPEYLSHAFHTAHWVAPGRWRLSAG